MLRDNLKTYSPPTNNDLSVIPNLEVLFILDFIDRNISGFRSYYLAVKESDRENWITDTLVYYFENCLRDEKSEGFPSFKFGKNPAQADSAKETDIGVVVLTKNAKPITIIEFEAKRLSDTSNNKEYVCGERGGIERFKRGQHATHLSVCGIFGYIQNPKLLKCAEKINGWIAELSVTNKDTTISWSGVNEKLVPLEELTNVSKWSSLNSRKNTDSIRLLHYFINLTN